MINEYLYTTPIRFAWFVTSLSYNELQINKATVIRTSKREELKFDVPIVVGNYDLVTTKTEVDLWLKEYPKNGKFYYWLFENSPKNLDNRNPIEYVSETVKADSDSFMSNIVLNLKKQDSSFSISYSLENQQDLLATGMIEDLKSPNRFTRLFQELQYNTYFYPVSGNTLAEE